MVPSILYTAFIVIPPLLYRVYSYTLFIVMKIFTIYKGTLPSLKNDGSVPLFIKSSLLVLEFDIPTLPDNGADNLDIPPHSIHSL